MLALSDLFCCATVLAFPLAMTAIAIWAQARSIESGRRRRSYWKPTPSGPPRRGFDVVVKSDPEQEPTSPHDPPSATNGE